MERGWHVMILLSTSTLFIPFRQHLLQYVSGKPGPTRMGQGTSQLSSARCPDDNFVTWQMCFGWTSAVCIGVQHGERSPGGPGWRWETGNMELKVVNNSKCPHLWFPSSSQTLMYATLNPNVLSQPPNCWLRVTRKAHCSSVLVPQQMDSREWETKT